MEMAERRRAIQEHLAAHKARVAEVLGESTAGAELADFLLARIAEDEADAQRWHYTSAGGYGRARLLAECTAKRALVAYAAPEDDIGQALLSAFADPSVDGAALAEAEPIARLMGEQLDEAMSYVLRALALPYASHPDYRNEWRP